MRARVAAGSNREHRTRAAPRARTASWTSPHGRRRADDEPSPHSPAAVGRVFGVHPFASPNCSARSRATIGAMSLSTNAARGHHGIDGESRGVVRIIRIAACSAHCPVGARMPPDESNRTIDRAGRRGQGGVGNTQQSAENEGRQRLAGTKESYVTLWKPPSAACCDQRYRAARASGLRSSPPSTRPRLSPPRKTRRSTRTIDREVQNRRTRHRHPAPPCDAVVTGPCAVAVLQAENLLRDVRMPFRPGIAAAALHAVADVEIREELLAAHRPVAADEVRTGELALNRAESGGRSVLCPRQCGSTAPAPAPPDTAGRLRLRPVRQWVLRRRTARRPCVEPR